MPNDKNERTELDKFFEGIRRDSPPLQETEPKPEKDETQIETESGKTEEGGEHRPNRAERRASENASIRRQLEEERIARAAAEARAQTMAELKTGEQTDDALHRALFGNIDPTPESKNVVANLQKVLDRNKQDASEAAYSRLKKEREDADKEERDAAREIDEKLSTLEEEYNVDLTSSSPAGRKAREEFLGLVEKLSPKDAQGNIIEYADFASAYEMYQSSRRKDSTQRKEVASRSMSRSSGEADQQNAEKSAWEKGRDQLRALGLSV